MMKYSEIKLDDNQKTLLKVFKASGYKSIGNDDMNGLVMSDGSRAVSLYGLKDFDWIETNSYYEIDKLLNPPHEPKTVWELEYGDAFWWISPRGIVCENLWDSTTYDPEYRSQGNVFLTKEEAEFEKKRREVVTKVRKYASPFNFNRANWAPYWNHNRESAEKIGWNSFSGYIQEAQLYFENEEKAKQAIAEVGEEDFKKYYLGVTE